MADCVLPEDLMLCILTRLPVKSILRFKSVCKLWRKLFSTREFIKLHHAQFSSDPKNQSLIIHRKLKGGIDDMFLFNIGSNVKEPTNIEYPGLSFEIDIVGCCNGLFCIRKDNVIVLWNPAMKLCKRIFPYKYPERNERVSIGFGYDAEEGDFKVVRIICLQNRLEISRVEVYSVNSDSWITIEPDFKCDKVWKNCTVIVNGNPYWVAMVIGNESAKNCCGEVLLCFDVRTLVFRIVPLSSSDLGEYVNYVDWNGTLGALMCNIESETAAYLDICVFDDGEQIWRKHHTFGPFEEDVYQFLMLMKNGEILGVYHDFKLVLFNPETGCVEDLLYEAKQLRGCGIYCCYGYIESLAYTEGMEKLEVTRKRTGLNVDDGIERKQQCFEVLSP